jgi:hypothetical protein
MSQTQRQQQAVCQFCSHPDDSVQVVCESRCLLCSRCQVNPGIRKLLVENTNFSDTVKMRSEELPKLPTSSGASSCAATSGLCPICQSPFSSSMLVIIQSYRDALRTGLEDHLMVSLLSSVGCYFKFVF